MPKRVEFENIEEMRRHVGIDDVQLRIAIRQLRAGDIVRVTLLNGAALATRLVRITSVRGAEFRGKLMSKRSTAASKRGAAVVFTSDHIHSIAKRSVEAE